MQSAIDNNLQVSVTNRQILKIALPISASLIIPSVNFITNNIFLGGLGIKELGNAGITGVYYLVLMVAGNGLGNALQAIISRKGGEGKPEAIPVIQVVSLGMMMVSIAAVWLNAVTGTGKTKMNLVIEVAAIIFYLLYSFILMKKLRLSLAVVWSNELVYWLLIFLVSFWFIKKGSWRNKVKMIK